MIWNTENNKLRRVNSPKEYQDSDADKVKATPNGKYFIAGYPQLGEIVFFELDFEHSRAEMILPTFRVSYFFYQTSD